MKLLSGFWKVASEYVHRDMSKCTEEVATMSGGGSRGPGRVEEGGWPAQTSVTLSVLRVCMFLCRVDQLNGLSSSLWVAVNAGHHIFPHFPSSHGGGSSMLLVACMIM